jgi:glycosyltransferase involved in cell wall biosynthesis
VRIAVIHNPDLANGAYRAVIPMAALQRRGHEVKRFIHRDCEPTLSIEELAEFDVVHVYRLIINNDDDYVNKLHEAGAIVSFDNDDDAASVPPELWQSLMGDVTEEWVELVVSEYERTLALLPQIDLVTTPSPVLAKRFEAAGAQDVCVIDNYLPPEFLRIRPEGRPGFIIGWHAGREHALDRDRLGIQETLTRILDAHGHVHVVSIGVDLGIESNRYTRVIGVGFRQLTNHLADFDIGIAPLADTDFGRARSSVKVREYAAAGVPWLASAVGPYEGLGEDEGGRLVGDEEWLEALEELIRSPRARARLRRRGKRWTRRNLIDDHVDLWEDAFASLVESARSVT